MSEVQLPTVGRIVHVHTLNHPAAPLPAMVVEVTDGSHTIDTLHMFCPDGIRVMNNVKHAGDATGGSDYWDWMAYQKGQAAKTEEIAKKLEEELAAQVRIGKTAPHGGEMARLASKVDHMREAAEAKSGHRVSDELSKTQAGVPSNVDGKR